MNTKIVSLHTEVVHTENGFGYVAQLIALTLSALSPDSEMVAALGTHHLLAPVHLWYELDTEIQLGDLTIRFVYIETIESIVSEQMPSWCDDPETMESVLCLGRFNPQSVVFRYDQDGYDRACQISALAGQIAQDIHSVIS